MAGKIKAAKIEMIAMTQTISSKVKPSSVIGPH
jgi:hypothetical protein